MIWKNKRAYQETDEDSIVPPLRNNRYLKNVYAVPNMSGGCSTVSLSFQFKGWIEGDLPELFQWTSENTGEIMAVESCIDLDTLESMCTGRIVFEWNDAVNCCD